MCLGYGGEQRESIIEGAPRVKDNAGGDGQEERAGVSAECGVNADRCTREPKASASTLGNAARKLLYILINSILRPWWGKIQVSIFNLLKKDGGLGSEW
jgi:hypothetical protein